MSNENEHDWDLGRLRIFATVVEAGSLTRAGAVLGMPQPAISRQIARLEKECGGRLFHRTGRGVTLTDLGERVLVRVRAMLEEAKGLAAEVHESAAELVGDVRVGALPSLYLTLVVPLCFHLLAHLPRVRLHVFEGSAGQIDQWLVNGFIDIGLPYRYAKNIADAEPLVNVASYVMGPPGNPVTVTPTLPFRALDGVPLILPGEPSGVRVLLNQLARREGIQLKVVVEADSTQIQKAMARLGGAYTVLPKHAASEELAQGTLVASRILGAETHRSIAMGITAARPATRATREVARTIRALMTGEAAHARLSDPDIQADSDPRA